MSFIDYNFFPILFFLGWNILTTKQFSPNSSGTRDYKILPSQSRKSTLSVFSLTSPTDQNIMQSHSSYQKTNNILEFVPEFRFLSVPPTNRVVSDSPTKYSISGHCISGENATMFLDSRGGGNTAVENQKATDIPIFSTKMINDQSCWSPPLNLSMPTHQINEIGIPKNKLFKHSILTGSNQEVIRIQAKTKPIHGFLNEKNTRLFTNDHPVNNRVPSLWLERNTLKADIFSFTFRSNTKRFVSSFFFHNYKIKPSFSRIESSLNQNWLKLSKDNKLKNIFFGGLCFSQNNTFFSMTPHASKKIQRRSNDNWLFNKIARLQASSRPKKIFAWGLRGQAKTQETRKKTNSPAGADFATLLQDSSFLWIRANTKQFNTINLTQKRRSNIRLVLRSQNQKLVSLNRFQIALCFSKILQPACFFKNDDSLNLVSSLMNRFENQDSFILPIGKDGNDLSSRSKNKFQRGYPLADSAFRQLDQENFDVNRYKKRKKNWYMKKFFQHIAWNMKYKMSNHLSDVDNSVFPIYNSENTRSVWLNDSSEKRSEIGSFLKPTDTCVYTRRGPDTFYQNRLLRIYAGSWYYENLLPESNCFDKKPRTRGELVLNSVPTEDWYSNLFVGPRLIYKTGDLKPKDTINQEKQLKSKQFAIAWLYKHRYDVLKNSVSGTHQNKFRLNSITQSNSHLTHQLKNTHLNNFKQYGFSPKLHTRLESDIGIYSLAHKLSSIGFRNGNSEIDIYPFKYNDSYRYNFQNLVGSDISNQHVKSFLGLSDVNSSSSLHLKRNDSRSMQNISGWTENGLTNNTTSEQKYKSSASSNFRPCGEFLDFQNPILSKIYAPVFQPPNLNLLSFITNSVLKVTPNSIRPRGDFASSNQIQPITNEYLNSLTPAGEEKKNRFWEGLFKGTRKTLQEPSNHQSRTLNNFHQKLPINGIHANAYPWVTQNAHERWSSSNSLWNFLSNSPLKPLSVGSRFMNETGDPKTRSDDTSSFVFSNRPRRSQLENTNTSLFLNSGQGGNKNASHLFLNPVKNSNVSQSITTAHEGVPIFSKQESLKNTTNRPWYFTEKPSCIKKPFVFFSSFRSLPYFFISETLSKKGVTFPEANLNHFLSINSLNDPLEKPTNSTNTNLSMPYFLFENSVPSVYKHKYPSALKENEKKIMKPWKGFLQHKSYNLKPLSTFIKKEIGYQTSLFGWVAKARSKTNQKIKHHNLFVSKKNSISNDLPLEKYTWKIFPPLFQPFTFRFIDLNLPRTWSSELFASRFKSTADLKANRFDFSTRFKNTRIKKKSFGSYPITQYVLSPLEQRKSDQTKPHTKLKKPFYSTKWNGTQKNFFGWSLPFYFSDFFRFSASYTDANQVLPGTETRSFVNDFDIPMINQKNPSQTKSNLSNYAYENNQNRLFEFTFPLTDINESKQQWNNNQKSGTDGAVLKKMGRRVLNETSKSFVGTNSKIIVYGEKPILKNRTVHGPPLKNQKESISLPSYLKNITNQNYQNLCPNNLNEFYFVSWILFNKTLFIYLSLHYLRKFISFLGTEYIRNLFKIFVTMKFIDGNILSIIKTFQDFNFQLNQQNVIDIKVNKQLKNIKRN